MRYLNDRHIRRIGIDWPALVQRIESTLLLMDTPEVVQPLKPYLRFRHPGNRIIAMPSFVGGEAEISGIKWIAGFPDNVAQGKPRAHSTIILNDPADGVPVAIINGGLLSQLRTAAVSAVMLRHYFALERRRGYRIGVIGWGPIGQRHLEMVMAMFGDRVERVSLHDLRGVDPETLGPDLLPKAYIASSWQEAYRQSDIVLTCTSSTRRYIDEPPLPGSLLLNISLREYTPNSVSSVKAVVVDNWQEVCRENTDIEQLHLMNGLTEQDTVTLQDVVYRGALREWAPQEPIFFNPMGMAAFDMTLSAYYWREAERLGVGILLED
ncbi:2,3-diaminopropionate biosynthesis protein SbnB [Cohnella cholangitidis]|uniref:2,3-diaminopropionate biosynthesis protein SbnB n=1 Tax=Cohnella cholangitidis TaxID=2598458 RepID=A0A7G5BZY9_9BACL|nr:2,3-diaminopropionate biosynthesis protein SbnB [Cohnella cholangitidis]QMV42523.1 2,3-diaminopropionate biosynthesis protein SbnB [Cohnella cholangitidis]